MWLITDGPLDDHTSTVLIADSGPRGLALSLAKELALPFNVAMLPVFLVRSQMTAMRMSTLTPNFFCTFLYYMIIILFSFYFVVINISLFVILHRLYRLVLYYFRLHN